jgi:hypothetical protein
LPSIGFFHLYARKKPKPAEKFHLALALSTQIMSNPRFGINKAKRSLVQFVEV